MENIYLIILLLKIIFIKYPILFIILGIFILLFITYGINIFNKERLDINDIKLNSDRQLMISGVIILLIIHACLFFFRVRNIGKSVDMKDIYKSIITFYLSQTTITITLILILMLIFLYFLFTFLIFLKKNTFLLYCKINFLIIYLLGVGEHRGETSYDKFKWNVYIKYFNKITLFPWRIIKIFIKDDAHYKVSSSLQKFKPFYGGFLLMFAFIYDILVNHLMLSSFFYILPWAILYQIGFSIDTAFGITYDIEDNIISNFLYDNNTLIMDDYYYIASNGYKYTKDELEEIKLFINNNFNRNDFRKE